MKRTMAAVLVAAFGFYSVAACAILVTPGSPIRVDFVFPIADPFALPARIVDHTVEFGPGGGAAALNIGEGYEIATFDANDVLLSIESYMNVADGNVIGCACTGGFSTHCWRPLAATLYSARLQVHSMFGMSISSLTMRLWIRPIPPAH